MASPTANDPVRVVVCEDHPLMREALRGHLSAADGDHIAVAAVVATGEDLVSRWDSFGANLALVDVDLTGGTMNGIDAARELLTRDPDARVVFYSAADDPKVIREAISMGANGFLSKLVSPTELVSSLLKAAAGETVYDSTTAVLAIKALQGPPEDRPALTAREREAVALAAEGLTNKAIAGRMGVAESTVKTLLGRCMSKLGAADRAAAVAEAIRQGIID